MKYTIGQYIISRIAALEPKFGFLPQDTALWRGTRHVSPSDILIELQDARFFSSKRHIAEGYLGPEVKKEEKRIGIKKNRYLIDAVTIKNIPCAFINNSIFDVMNSIWGEVDIGYYVTPQIFQANVLPVLLSDLMNIRIGAYCQNDEVLLCSPAEDISINSIQLYDDHSFSVVQYQGSS